VRIEDRVGNRSDPILAPCYLIEAAPPTLGAKAKIAGDIASEADVAAYVVDLLAGDSLSIKTKAGKGDPPLLLALDVVDPLGQAIVLGRHPPTSKKVEVKGLVAPETGRYLVILRRAEDDLAGSGTWALAGKIKTGKANKGGKGTVSGADVEFPAADGSLLKASLKGDGLTAAAMSIEGPGGEVPFTAKEKNGKVSILPVVLDAGTGTYRIRVPHDIAVAWKVSLKRQ
jgi:hypothetical protein